LLSQTRNGFTSYYLKDGQGSTRTLTNTTGNITDTYSYSAFGELQNQTGTTVNHYLYTGQQFDNTSGLYSLRARYYAPGVGRFLSQDTYGINFSNPLELNRYGYSANNPVNASDPSGYFAEYAGININSARNIQAVAMIGAAVKSGFIIALVMLPGGILAGELLGLDDLVRELVRDLPQEKTLTQQAMEQAWADYQALKARLAPTPSPNTDPTPEPQLTPIPPLPLGTPQNGCDAPPWTDWTAPYEIAGDPSGNIHHIATDKHNTYWTPLFSKIFALANLSLRTAKWNLIRLEGHQGPHQDEYHTYVFRELQSATAGLQCNPYRHALEARLWLLKKELTTPNSPARILLGLQP